MTDPTHDTLNEFLFHIAQAGIRHAVKGLSEMTGQELTATAPVLRFVPILKVPDQVGGLEKEVVGVYLRASGEMAGQFMLILPYSKALEFVDVLMLQPSGTTQELDDMGKSALAEMGNLAGSFFLNAIAEQTRLETLPSTPAVIFDMVGAVLDVIVATSAEAANEVIMIQTSIMHGEMQIKADFWYIPDPRAMQVIEQFVQQRDPG